MSGMRPGVLTACSCAMRRAASPLLCPTRLRLYVLPAAVCIDAPPVLPPCTACTACRGQGVPQLQPQGAPRTDGGPGGGERQRQVNRHWADRALLRPTQRPGVGWRCAMCCWLAQLRHAARVQPVRAVQTPTCIRASAHICCCPRPFFHRRCLAQVLLDGRDIRELNLRWLRENIGLVGQEPVLFNMTVAGGQAGGWLGGWVVAWRLGASWPPLQQ